MIIHASHKWWMMGTALVLLGALAAWRLFGWDDPDGLRGSSTLGLWYGIAAAACMVYAGVLPLHRRRVALKAGWTGPRQRWLRGHIWLGLLSVPLVLLHSGCRFRGTLVLVLSLIVGLVVLSGLFGLLLQGVLPRRITTQVEWETPLGQLARVCQVWRQETDQLLDQVCGPLGPTGPKATGPASPAAPPATAQLRRFYEEAVRPFLHEAYPRGAKLLDPVRAGQEFDRLRNLADVQDKEKGLLTRLEEVTLRRRVLAEQQRLHAWLHAWLLIHVPLSAALLVLGVAHVVTALRY